MKRSTGSQGWPVLLFVALVTTISGCAIHYTNASGMERNRRVVDKATGVGVSEAFVVFKWNEERDSIAHSTTICARLAILTTGPDGRYTVPDWNGRVPLVNRIYKRGYKSASDDESVNRGIDYVVLSKKTGDERGEELTRMVVGCREGEDRKLIEFYQALYDELKAITPIGMKSQFDSYFETQIEYAKYGREESFRRYEERVKRERGVK